MKSKLQIIRTLSLILIIASVMFLSLTLVDSGNPTTIKLQEPDTENLEDSYVSQGAAGSNYGSEASFAIRDNTDTNMRTYIKFNLSAVPSGQTIENAVLFFYLYVNGTTNTAAIHHVYNQTWNELAITWNNQPCGTGFDDSGNCNLTAEDTETTAFIKWYNWTVTEAVSTDYADSKTNVSFIIKTPEVAEFSVDYFRSKHETENVSLRPYLNITYSEAPPVDTCTYTSGNWNVSCGDFCNITEAVAGDGSNISIIGTGEFTMENNISGFNYYKIRGPCIVTCNDGCFRV